MAQDNESYRLAAVGDAMLSREVGEGIQSNPEAFLLNDVRAFLDKYDSYLIFPEFEITHFRY